MRIAVLVPAGLAARSTALAKAGAEVPSWPRAHLTAIRTRGLKVLGPRGITSGHPCQQRASQYWHG
jgi:hypothetical protein